MRLEVPRNNIYLEAYYSGKQDRIPPNNRFAFDLISVRCLGSMLKEVVKSYNLSK